MSKGSDRRPRQISEAEEQANWNRIFKKDHLNELLRDDEMGFNNNLDNHQNVNPKDEQHERANKTNG